MVYGIEIKDKDDILVVTSEIDHVQFVSMSTTSTPDATIKSDGNPTYDYTTDSYDISYVPVEQIVVIPIRSGNVGERWNPSTGFIVHHMVGDEIWEWTGNWPPWDAPEPGSNIQGYPSNHVYFHNDISRQGFIDSQWRIFDMDNVLPMRNLIGGIR